MGRKRPPEGSSPQACPKQEFMEIAPLSEPRAGGEGRLMEGLLGRIRMAVIFRG